jgi:hypothetical protein
MFAACFDLHKVIIRRIYKNSILVLELCFSIWIRIIIIVYHLIVNTTFLLKYNLTNTHKKYDEYTQSFIRLKNLKLTCTLTENWSRICRSETELSDIKRKLTC